MWGTPYEMGFAQGQLMAKEIRNTLDSLEQIVELQLDKWLQFLPKEIRDLFELFGKDALALVLELEVLATEPFVKAYFLDELKGIADGSGACVVRQ